MLGDQSLDKKTYKDVVRGADIAEKRDEVLSFVQVCDPQLGMGGYEHDVATFSQAIEQINLLDVDFVCICGDMVDRPDPKSYRDFKGLRKSLVPETYCVPGNHDVLFEAYDREKDQSHAQSLQNYRDAFGADYFSFSSKKNTFICVNSQLWTSELQTERESQDRWLREELELAKDKGESIWLITHHPLYLESPEEEDGYFNVPKDLRQKYLSLCIQYGVSGVLSGHTHRPIVNRYREMELVAGEPTSVAFRGELGFRLWRIFSDRSYVHQFVPLDLSHLKAKGLIAEGNES